MGARRPAWSDIQRPEGLEPSRRTEDRSGRGLRWVNNGRDLANLRGATGDLGRTLAMVSGNAVIISSLFREIPRARPSLLRGGGAGRRTEGTISSRTPGGRRGRCPVCREIVR